MESLIRELQRDTLNGDISVSDLLRKAYVAAKKLELQEFEKWIELELNGYPPPTELEAGCLVGSELVFPQDLWKELPEYRWVPGTWKFYIDVEGKRIVTKPILGLAKQLEKMHVPISISEIERIAYTDESRSGIQLHDPAKILLTGRSDFEAVFWVATHYYHKILNAVRNIILKWALELEEKGILGDGLAFTAQEKKTASNFTFNINQLIQKGGHEMKIEIANSTIGMLNTGEILAESITTNISALNDSNQQRIAEAFNSVTESVKASQDISSQQQNEILEQLELLSKQATLAPSERKVGLIRPTLSALAATLSAGGGLAEIWSKWGSAIEGFFGIRG